MLLRPVRDSPEDAEAVHEVALSVLGKDAQPDADPDDASARRTIRHLARHDAAGCWLAEEGGIVTGAVLSLRREGLWGVSLFAVRPDHQDRGLGRALLERAAEYGRGCVRSLVVAPPDGRAARRHRAAGFAVHPAMRLRGRVRHDTLPGPDGVPVTTGGETHLHLLDSIDRRVRGAAHGPDHRRLLAEGNLLLVVETLAGSGYCFVGPSGPVLLAATSRRLATRLLFEAFASVPRDREVTVPALTAAQDWALDAGLLSGLRLETHGFVCVRGMHPPAPYIPSAVFM